MSELKVISAREFRKKATRIIEIDGFEPGEKIAVRIKPASLLNLLMGGKLPNNLLGKILKKTLCNYLNKMKIK